MVAKSFELFHLFETNYTLKQVSNKDAKLLDLSIEYNVEWHKIDSTVC